MRPNRVRLKNHTERPIFDWNKNSSLRGAYSFVAELYFSTFGFLQACGQYSDAQIVDLVLSTCFDGLAAR